MVRYKTKKGSPLWLLGLGATIWWAVSGLYLVLLVLVAKDYFIKDGNTSVFSISGWQKAVNQAIDAKSYLVNLFLIIVSVWILIGIVWFISMKKAKISYKEGLKYLFLTIK